MKIRVGDAVHDPVSKKGGRAIVAFEEDGVRKVDWRADPEHGGRVHTSAEGDLRPGN